MTDIITDTISKDYLIQIVLIAVSLVILLILYKKQFFLLTYSFVSIVLLILLDKIDKIDLTWKYLLDYLFNVENAGNISIFIMLTVFISLLLPYLFSQFFGTKQYVNVYHILIRLLIGSLSASVVPTGLALIVCAFDLSLISSIKGVEVYVGFAGLALIFIAILATCEEAKRMKTPPGTCGDDKQ